MLSLFTVILVVSTSTSVIRECQELEGASYDGVKKIISSFAHKCLNCLKCLNVSQNFTTDRDPDQMFDVQAESSGQGPTELQSIHPPRESVAVKPDPGISQRVSFGPSKKKDIGALGYALGALLMVVIIVLGTGISIGYVYRRGVKLRQQQEQRAYEQEMCRMNLPLSAFTNPGCDLTDEQPVAASVEKFNSIKFKQEELTKTHQRGWRT